MSENKLHHKFNKILTKENDKIIDTNWQCSCCGKTLSTEELEDFYIYNCEHCKGSGKYFDGQSTYSCQCKSVFGDADKLEIVEFVEKIWVFKRTNQTA